MKKTLLNIAIALTLSGSTLLSQAYASPPITVDNINSNKETTETYMLPGAGVGAATGTAIAGPVGFVVGGLIGAFVGASQEIDGQKIDNEYDNPQPEEVHAEIDSIELPSIQVAQLSSVRAVTDDPVASQQNDILDILTTDLSLDIYFRSGSTAIEIFYPARLDAIANLMKNMDQLELHLDGYTDRRGNQTQNIALANQRLNNVRQQLITSGVDANRIISKAFGEMKMVSRAGDLEGYTFDRKVVIRFERSSTDSIHAMTTALSELDVDDVELEGATTANKSIDDPIVAEAATRF